MADVVTHDVTTIEGLGPRVGLHPLQRAFLDEAAFQCGYCTPGMLLAGAALLDRDPGAIDSDMRAAMDGNICRCGVYPRILQALRQGTETAATFPPAAA